MALLYVSANAVRKITEHGTLQWMVFCNKYQDSSLTHLKLYGLKRLKLCSVLPTQLHVYHPTKHRIFIQSNYYLINIV